MIRTIQSLHRYLLLAVALLPLISLPSCQRKSLVEDVQVESVLISELKMSDKALPELEKTLFSIDQRKGLIYLSLIHIWTPWTVRQDHLCL